LAALVVTPPRTWWIWLVGALPANLIAQSRDAAPLFLLICPFLANVAQAVLAAIGLRRLMDVPYRLESLREMSVFILVAVLAAPALVSFTAAWLFVAAGWETDYWLAAEARLLNNITTGLTVAPLCLAIAGGDLVSLRRFQLRRYVEFGILLIGLAVTISIAFAWQATETIKFPIRLYAPLPFLFWAAVRFRPAALSIALLIIAYDTISDSIAGQRIFAAGSGAANVLAVEASLGVLSLPLMLLAALMQERTRKEEALRESEARYRALVTASSEIVWRGNPRGEGLFVTAAWRELTGQSETESRKGGWLEAVHPDDRERCLRLWDQAVAQHHAYENELRVRASDGSYRHFYVHVVPIVSPDHGVREWVGAATDITDRKRAEHTLRESEARFRNMADHAPVMIWISDLTGAHTYVNKQWSDFTGIAGEDALGFGWLEAVHSGDRERTRATFLAAHERNEEVRMEYPLRRHDGEYRWVINSATPRFSQNGEFLGFIGSVIDIAERKRAEDSVRESEERLALALQAGKMGVWEWDTRTDRLEWSSEHFTIMGLVPFSEMPTYRTWAERVHPDDLQSARVAAERAIAQRGHYYSEYRIVLADQTYRWVSARGEPIYNHDGECVRVMGVIVDITDRKRAESRLHVQYRVTRVLSESASLPDAARAALQVICDCFDWHCGELWQVGSDPNGLTYLDGFSVSKDAAEFVSASRKFTFASGVGLPGRVWNSGSPAWITDIGSDADFPRAALAKKAGLRSAFACPIKLSDRTLGVMAFFSRTTREPDAELLQIMESIGGQIGQFVERKQAEAALRASEERKRAIVESAFDSMITIDHQGRVVEFNAAAEKTFAYKRTDAIGKHVGEVIFPPALRDGQYRGLENHLVTGKGTVLDKRLEMTAMRADGSEFPIELAITRIRLDPLPMFTAYVRDITERKHGEEALRHALAEVQRLKERAEADNVYLREELSEAHRDGEIVGKSDAIRKVLTQVRQVAVTDLTVLILGETGTGKELVARAIHGSSARKERPLVKVNCSALPAELMESELFGHEKGAFTGAVGKRIGRFELADGGTIFLDEIGDLALSLQAKLLRVLQEGQFERVGSSKTIHVNVRVIAATNRDLSEALRQETFRSDLYYRLAVYPIQMPPLRERKQDIELMAEAFLKETNRRLGKSFEAIPRRLFEALERYDWPGNVRELQNVIERAVVTSTGRSLELPESWHPAVPVKSFAQNGMVDSAASAPRNTLEDRERAHIIEVLNQTHWRIEGPKGAAVVLGLHPSTLRSRMQKLGIGRSTRPRSEFIQ
jgi:PAS domain S-box-containing protein